MVLILFQLKIERKDNQEKVRGSCENKLGKLKILVLCYKKKIKTFIIKSYIYIYNGWIESFGTKCLFSFGLLESILDESKTMS